jgi:ATP-dependent Clp protease, protease subunit
MSSQESHPAVLLRKPDIRLLGDVDDEMQRSFLDQLDKLREGENKELLLELSTQGGEADVGVRIAEDLRLLQEQYAKQCYVIGKGAVFSAGVTIMSAIPPTRRFLTRYTRLLIHGRKLDKDVHLDGPLDACMRVLQQVVSEIESGQHIQRATFTQLVEGTQVSMAKINEKAGDGWYLSSEEALECGLVAGVL